ncbi:TIGR04149 family rSAM-modified RiPP [uncultured Bacteroides sp.]|uniref:TIGR04149 family rSAM-modified RiPP n=1 Tax=uncultured Bacteroides sp. TaxID=162156 RepID=UPI0025F92708|nr:TIGR04149 family rSAM-modified RiPP [uncultured Bacteroides sp.]
MKKIISPIKLHNLSEAEMETRELNLLRGGSGSDKRCPCVSACLPDNCSCMSAGLAHVVKEASSGNTEERESSAVTSMSNYVENHPGSF